MTARQANAIPLPLYLVTPGPSQEHVSSDKPAWAAAAVEDALLPASQQPLPSSATTASASLDLPAYSDVVAATTDAAIDTNANNLDLSSVQENDPMLVHLDLVNQQELSQPFVTPVTRGGSARIIPKSLPRLLNAAKRASLEKASIIPHLLLNPSKKRGSLDITSATAATAAGGGRTKAAARPNWFDSNNHNDVTAVARQLHRRRQMTRCNSDAVSPSLSVEFAQCRSPSSSLMTPASGAGNNPLITITIEPDHDSLFHDYITSEVPRLGGGGGGRDGGGGGEGGAKDPPLFVGDDASLYGMPREDLTPIRETSPVHQSTTDFLKDQIVAFFQPSDNKLAMKLFGSKNALNRERCRQKEAGNWVIHPCSNFRLVTHKFCCVNYGVKVLLLI